MDSYLACLLEGETPTGKQNTPNLELHLGADAPHSRPRKDRTPLSWAASWDREGTFPLAGV